MCDEDGRQYINTYAVRGKNTSTAQRSLDRSDDQSAKCRGWGTDKRMGRSRKLRARKAVRLFWVK